MINTIKFLRILTKQLTAHHRDILGRKN